MTPPIRQARSGSRPPRRPAARRTTSSGPRRGSHAAVESPTITAALRATTIELSTTLCDRRRAEVRRRIIRSELLATLRLRIPWAQGSPQHSWRSPLRRSARAARPRGRRGCGGRASAGSPPPPRHTPRSRPRAVPGRRQSRRSAPSLAPIGDHERDSHQHSISNDRSRGARKPVHNLPQPVVCSNRAASAGSAPMSSVW